MRLCIKTVLMLGLCTLVSVSSAAAQSAPKCLGDVNGDGVVDIHDMVSVLNAFGSRGAAYRANIHSDLYVDGLINGADLAIVQSRLGESCKTCPHDYNNDGTVGGADLAVLLAGGGVSGSGMVALLNDWGTNCAVNYVAPTKRTIRGSDDLIQKRIPSRADIAKAKALAGSLGQ
jgi:hypothetical protein